MPTKPNEQLQLVLESLALSQLQQICDISSEGMLMIHQIRARMALEQIRINAAITPSLVMDYLMEKYSDGPTGPIKTNSGL